MSHFADDLKYACRMLRKNPGFTTIALVTLAIGIGANTIMFSVVNMLFLRPVQVHKFDELAVCLAENASWHFPYGAFQELKETNPVFTDMAAVSPMQLEATCAMTGRANQARKTVTACVSSNYFSVLGVKPAYGRWFLPEEERFGAESVVVLSHALWQRCGGESGIVGKQILLDGKPFRVVGVACEGFTGATMSGWDCCVPLGAYGVLAPKWRAARKEAEPCPNVIPVGRLKPQFTMTSAQAQLQALMPSLRENNAQWWAEVGRLKLNRPSRLSLVSSATSDTEHEKFSLLTACLMSVSGVVMLIACLNLAGMMVVQGTSRQREIAIRLALGGGRFRIVTQLLMECLLMSLAGGVLGCVLASAGSHAVNAWLRANPFPIELPSSFRVALDGRVLLGTLGFCAIATLLFGLKPALRLSRRDVLSDLKESGRDALRSSTKKRWIPTGLSVVAQTALSVVLIMGAALFVRSAHRATQAPDNLSLDGKLIVEIDLQAAGYETQRSRQICQSIKDRFLALPGVDSVALSRSSHFTQSDRGGGPVYEYTPDVEQQASSSQLAQGSTAYHIGMDYIKTLGLSLLQGRPFNELDGVADREKVVIINEQLARQIRSDGNALNSLIRWGHGKSLEKASSYRVVGIVQDVTRVSQDMTNVQAKLYLPLQVQAQPRFVHVLARNKTRRGQGALLGTLAQEIYKIDSRLPVISLSTLEDRLANDETVWLTGLGARLATTFGAMALFLAALGVYAIKGYMVASRTPEIGIRKALGATHQDIILMVFRQGSVLMLVGLGLGLVAGLALAHVSRSLFVNVSPVDPISIGVTIVVLALASVLAGVMPARRAVKIDPMEALRYE